MWVRRVGAYLVAAMVTYALAAIAATQSVIGSLGRMGVQINTGQRLSMTGHDLVGMAGLFLPLVAVALLIAFLLTALLVRRLPGGRRWLFPLAGAAAMLALHLAMKAAFGITPIAAARSTTGLLVQALAGAAGGYVLMRLAVGSSRSAK